MFSDFEDFTDTYEPLDQVPEISPISDLQPENYEANALEALHEVFTPEVISEWPDLAPEERLEYAEQASNNLNDALGTDAQLNLRDLGPVPPGTYGFQDSGTVTLNTYLFENPDPRELVDTISHEHFHEFQDLAVKDPEYFGLDAETAQEWRDNMGDNYISSSKDFPGYWEQPIESSARDFAAKMTQGLGLPQPESHGAPKESVSYTMLPNHQMAYTTTIGNNSAYTTIPGQPLIYTTKVGA